MPKITSVCRLDEPLTIHKEDQDLFDDKVQIFDIQDIILSYVYTNQEKNYELSLMPASPELSLEESKIYVEFRTNELAYKISALNEEQKVIESDFLDKLWEVEGSVIETRLPFDLLQN